MKLFAHSLVLKIEWLMNLFWLISNHFWFLFWQNFRQLSVKNLIVRKIKSLYSESIQMWNNSLILLLFYFNYNSYRPSNEKTNHSIISSHYKTDENNLFKKCFNNHFNNNHFWSQTLLWFSFQIIISNPILLLFKSFLLNISFISQLIQ